MKTKTKAGWGRLRLIADQSSFKFSKRGVRWTVQTKIKGVATVTSEGGRTLEVPCGTLVMIL